MQDRIRVVKEFRMDKLPRAVGNPHQHIVTNPIQFIHFMKRNNGKTPLYTSHNSYPDLDKHFNPKTVRVRNVFLDFDEREDGEFHEPSHDAQLVSDFLSDNNIAHTIAFSGRQGFHLYIQLNDSIEELTNGISLKYRAIYAYLRRELSLKTLDMQCAEPKRLCRIPSSKYVKKDEHTDRYCMPVPKGMDLPRSRKEMFDMSYSIPSLPYMRGEEMLTIDEFMDEFNINPDTTPDVEMYDTVDYNIPDNQFMQMIGEFFRPCVRNAIFRRNPTHFARVGACIKLKRIHFSEEKAKKIFDRISKEAKWVDRANTKRRYKNIESIYKYNYHMPNCRNIKLKGLCIGEDCEYYQEGLSEEEEK
ncbi:hypothetical protein AKJ51_04035 [candidate division MSBL1 archaeon SCGC-AAA382A20]|uniref:Uncharacterized protein n=1 Tax=candidate division MSBL1 archaeon SCGC-AAA382A20 TaxID=1698280 RepID=A0A133VIE1_9EURY|nr:hypothetical protein AKJ51_04035 [candidate division MSBL1 archaeon SCGC-AAA382A20]